MICKLCRHENQSSTVTPGLRLKTLMYFPPRYDEKGRLHVHDRNNVTQDFRCSRGHEWVESCAPADCPTCGPPPWKVAP